MKFPVKYSRWIIAATMIALTYGLAYHAEQHEFWRIIGFYLPLCLIYWWICKLPPFKSSDEKYLKPEYRLHLFGNINISELRFYLALAVLLRLILVFSMPQLSNDVYRFIWDGRLLVHGLNPFDYLPMHYLQDGQNIPGLDKDLFEAFGAKNTYTVYPPLAQAQFGSAVYLFPSSVYWSVVVMKLWLFLFEIGTIAILVLLLKHFQLPARNVLLYALNPLIIAEICGNLHFEGAMIFFLLLSFWFLLRSPNSRSYFIASAVSFALSVCSKLLPLMFLPYLIRKLGWRKSALFFFVVGLTVVLLFAPLVNPALLNNFFESLNLYFQKLEFNASIYYLLRWFGFLILGYNPIAVIGPLLGAIVFFLIFYLAVKKTAPTSYQSLLKDWLIAISIYLLATTTLHPWYLALPIVLAVFTKWRFPFLWSILIFGTYINYSFEPYREMLAVVAIEYVLVALFFVWEWKTCRKKQNLLDKNFIFA